MIAQLLADLLLQINRVVAMASMEVVCQTKQLQARDVLSELMRASHWLGGVRFGRHEPV